MSVPPTTALRFARGIAILTARFGEHFTIALSDDTASAGCASDDDAVPLASVNDAERDELESLGWTWSVLYESWEFNL